MNTTPNRALVHTPTDDGQGYCRLCGTHVRQGAGPLVHDPIGNGHPGFVAARTPAIVLDLRSLVADWQQRASELAPERPETYENNPQDELNDAIGMTYADLANALTAVLDGSPR